MEKIEFHIDSHMPIGVSASEYYLDIKNFITEQCITHRMRDVKTYATRNLPKWINMQFHVNGECTTDIIKDCPIIFDPNVETINKLELTDEWLLAEVGEATISQLIIADNNTALVFKFCKIDLY